MSAGGHIDPSNKKVALLIAVLALVLAFSETLGKGAQTTALSANIEASNLWAFFQAKTIRMTEVRTAAEQAALASPSGPEGKAATEKQIDSWQKPPPAMTRSRRRRRAGRRIRRARESGRSKARPRARGLPQL